MTATFRDGQLYKEIPRRAGKSRLWTHMWIVVPDRRQLIRKGGKP